MFAATAFLSLAIEVGPHLQDLRSSPYFYSFSHGAISFLISAMVGSLAFLMIWVEFNVLNMTSALTLVVGGQFKEIVTVLAGVVAFNEPFTVLNGFGLLVIVAGALLYNAYRHKHA